MTDTDYLTALAHEFDAGWRKGWIECGCLTCEAALDTGDSRCREFADSIMQSMIRRFGIEHVAREVKNHPKLRATVVLAVASAATDRRATQPYIPR